MADLQKFI